MMLCDWLLTAAVLSTLQITVYIGKRDFIDYLTKTDPIGQWCQSVIRPIRLTSSITLATFQYSATQQQCAWMQEKAVTTDI